MESSKENSQPEFRSFTPKEGPVAPEYVQLGEKHLRELLKFRDRLTQKLLTIDQKDEKQFEELHRNIVEINEDIKKESEAIAQTMDNLEKGTRAWLEHGINPKKDKIN